MGWSLIGNVKGPQGDEGLSAYEVAVANGFVGTEAAWLASLVGEQGPEGPPTFQETGPAFTYTSGLVTRIDYDSGNYKLFTYTSGVLTQIDYVRPGSTTIRKTFTYSGDVLSSITQTEV